MENPDQDAGRFATRHTTLAGLLLLATCSALASGPRWEECAVIHIDQERLSCYDRMAGRQQATIKAEPQAASKQQEEVLRIQDKAIEPSMLARHWELEPAVQRGTFNFRPHQENYLIGTYNTSPNDAPYRPFRRLGLDLDLSHAELAFQLGFKLKLAEDIAGQAADLWFGYTQRSFWQAENQEASSPFRETNYQPELMAVFPVNLNLPGLRLRFLNAGIAHQSNGQGSTLSRSWNRAYLQAGFERGNFTLLARVWKRLNESADKDDNPDIVDYMGRGDLVGSYRWNGHDFSLLTRYNFQTDKSAAQLSWAFPLHSKLKGYVQFFSGYGYTLIDYNVRQRVIGLGVLVDF